MFETKLFNANITRKEDDNPTNFNTNEIVEEIKNNLSGLTRNLSTL